MIVLLQRLFARWKEAIIGITLGTVLFLGWQNFDAAKRFSEPAETFFSVKKLEVADFEQGVIPTVTYSIKVNDPMVVQYTTQVVKIADRTNGESFALIHPIVCQGLGTRNFDEPSKYEFNDVSADWFIHSSCIIPPGEYRLMTTWNITVEGYPTKIYQKESNLFEVF